MPDQRLQGSASQSERARTLRAVLDRVRAEIVGVENGVLPLIEEAGRPVESREVSARLGMTIPGANNALKALWLAGLIEREHVLVKGGGRAFAYTVATNEQGGSNAGDWENVELTLQEIKGSHGPHLRSPRHRARRDRDCAPQARRGADPNGGGAWPIDQEAPRDSRTGGPRAATRRG